MIDEKIKRFCQVVVDINEMNKELDDEKRSFYDGGMSFEECNRYKIDEIVVLQNELKDLLKVIN